MRSEYTMKNKDLIVLENNNLIFPDNNSIPVTTKSDIFVNGEQIIVNGVMVYDCNNSVKIDENLIKLVAYCEKNNENDNVTVGLGIKKLTVSGGSVINRF